MIHTSSHQPHGKRHDYQWFVLGALALLVLFMGYTGFLDYAHEHHESPSPLGMLYHTIQLFVLHSPPLSEPLNWKLEIARYAAAIIAFYTVFDALHTLFREQFQSLFLRFKKNHVVICGLGRKGLQLARSFRKQGDTVVVIEKDGGNDFVRICRELGIVALIGDATDVRLLKKAGVHKARYLVAICGKDGTNLEIAVHTRQLIQKNQRTGKNGLECHVHIADGTLRTAFNHHKVLTATTDRFNVSLFNIYENSARILLNAYPLDYVPITADSARFVHLVIIGFGQMGEAVLLQAARVGHYANGKKPRATIIDHEASKKMKRFYHRYPQFEQACEASFLEMEAEDRQTMDTLEALCKEQHAAVTLAVCFDDDERVLSFALNILPIVTEYHVPMRVRMAEQRGLATFFMERGKGTQASGNVHIFGMTGETCTCQVIIHEELDKLARAIHSNYVKEKREEGKTPETKPTMRAWELLDGDIVDSNRQAADHIPVKLRAIGCSVSQEDAGKQPVTEFKEEEVRLMAKMEHERYCAERYLAGWKHGEDIPQKKTNPTLIPWDQLKDGDTEYNYKSVRKIPHQLGLVNKKVYLI